MQKGIIRIFLFSLHLIGTNLISRINSQVYFRSRDQLGDERPGACRTGLYDSLVHHNCSCSDNCGVFTLMVAGQLESSTCVLYTIATIVFQLSMSYVLQHLRFKIMPLNDVRVRLLADMISGIRVLKANAWE